MTDILERLADLHKQATVERSHNYSGAVIYDALEEIKKLRFQIDTLEQLLTAYMTAQRPKATAKK